jgi:hypothetical protein
MKQITKIALKTALVSLTTYVTSSLVIKGIFRRVIEKDRYNVQVALIEGTKRLESLLDFYTNNKSEISDKERLMILGEIKLIYSEFLEDLKWTVEFYENPNKYSISDKLDKLHNIDGHIGIFNDRIYVWVMNKERIKLNKEVDLYLVPTDEDYQVI